MGEDYVGMFGLQTFGEVSVPERAYFRIAVNLSGKYRTPPQDCTSLLALGRANGCGLLRTLPWDPRFPASQVKQGNIMSQIGIQCDRSSTARFRVIRVRTSNHYPKFSVRIRSFAPRLVRQQR